MKIHQRNNLKSFEEYLKKCKIKSDIDSKHEQELRRILLNSDFFNTSFIIRWKKRLGFENMPSISFVSFSLLSGIFLAFILHFISVQPEILTNNSKTSITHFISQSNSKEMLQDLYSRGLIQYAHQNEDGARVYRMKSSDNSIIEIHDKTPLRIQLSSIRQ